MERGEADRILTALLLLVFAAFLAMIWIVTRPAGDPVLERAVASLAADNAELREMAKTLRQRCPARPRYQRAPLIRGHVV